MTSTCDVLLCSLRRFKPSVVETNISDEVAMGGGSLRGGSGVAPLPLAPLRSGVILFNHTPPCDISRAQPYWLRDDFTHSHGVPFASTMRWNTVSRSLACARSIGLGDVPRIAG